MTTLNRNERNLLIGQAISLIGDFIALPVLVIVAAQRGPALLSIFLTAYFLPRCLQPFLGALIDRYDARLIALASDGARAVLFTILFFYPLSAPAGPWIACATLASFLTALFEPARLKIMGAVSGDFGAYNRCFKILSSTASLGSLGLALLIEKLAYSELAFLINAVTFVMSFAFLVPVAYVHSSTGWRHRHPLEEVVAGFKLLMRRHAVLYGTGLIVLVDFITGVLYATFPGKTEGHGLGAIGTYVFFFTVCLGNSIGAALMRPDRMTDRNVATLCLLAVTCAVAFQTTGPLAVLLALSAIFFGVQMIVITHSENAISRYVAADHQGRMFALNESLPYLALSIGSLLAGSLGPAVTLAALLSVMAIFAAVLAVGPRPAPAQG